MKGLPKKSKRRMLHKVRGGINIGRSAAIILQTRILDVLALILLSIPALILFSEKAAPNWIRTTIFICLFLVAVPIGIVILDKKHFLVF